jgi:23S rRNA (cytosine1962-C5)-methyltransferase
VTVDRYGDFATLSVATEESFARRIELATRLVELGAQGVYLKVRVRADVRRLSRDEVAPRLPLAGREAPETLVVSEGALRFHVRLADGLSTGLFVDQRDNRRLVQQLSGGRMLNLFAYTGSFTVAAAAGGAVTTSVDISARALHHARENLILNGFDPASHHFAREDVVTWLRRALRHDARFDLVVLDPPSFGSRGGKGAFSMAKSFPEVIRNALLLLVPGGQLLAVTNHRKTSVPRLRKLVHQAARDARRELSSLKDLRSPLDCPPGFDGPAPSKSVLVTVA